MGCILSGLEAEGLLGEEAALEPQPAGHLLGTPALGQETPDPLQVCARELPIPAGVSSGALLGGVIGARVKTESWKFANPERAQVTIRPSERGVAAAISLRF